MIIVSYIQGNWFKKIQKKTIMIYLLTSAEPSWSILLSHDRDTNTNTAF